MDLSDRNRKVAISRWNNIIGSEKKQILSNKEGILLKSAICGFLAGDGSVQIRDMGSYNKHQIDFFPDDKTMLRTYIKYMKRVYNKTPSIRRKGKIFAVRISSRTIGEDLAKETEFGIKRWKIPLNLLSSNEAKKYWLKAFFSAEGYVNPRTIKIQTVNKKGMIQLSNLLNELQINHNCYNYTPKKNKHSMVYIIRIDKKEARKKFYYEIGFWHSKKMEILKRAVL